MMADGVPSSSPFFQVEGGISKEALLEIYAEVLDGTFKVFAPFGLPGLFWRYCPKALFLDRYSGLFEQALDVVSEAVYASRGLSETAVAVAVHQYVETEADEHVRESIKAMQSALLQLVDPPEVIEVPRVVSKEEFVSALRVYLEGLGGVVDGGERGPPLVAKGRKDWLKRLYGAIRSVQQDPRLGKGGLGYEALHGFAGVYDKDPEVRELIDQVTARSALGDDFYRSTMGMLRYDKEVDGVWTPAVLARFCRFTEAVEEGMEMVALNNPEDARQSLGDALRRTGERDEDDDEEEEDEEDEEDEEGSLEELRRRLPRSAVARVYVARAACFLASGETEAAVVDLTTALEKDVRCSPAYQARAGIYKDQGRMEEAVDDYCRAFVLEGLKSATEVQHLEAALKASYREEAVSLLQTRPSHRDLPADWLVKSYFRSFRAEMEEGSIRKAVLKEEEETGFEGERVLREAMHKRWEGDYKGAFQTLQAAVVGGLPFHSTAMKALAGNQWGSFLYLTGDLVGAEAVLRESLELDHSSCNTRLKLGEVLCDMGRIEEGLILLDEAVSLHPYDTDALLHRGQSLLTHDDLVQSVLDLRKSLEMFDGVPIGWACLGTALFKLEEGSDEAQRVLEDAVGKYSDNLEVLLYYGDVVAQKGDLVGAMKRFQQATQVEPLCPLPYVNAARAYMTVRDLPLAEKHLQEAIRLDPRCSSCYLDMGQLSVQSGDLEAAQAQFDLALQHSRYLPEIQDALVFRKLAQIQAEQALPFQQPQQEEEEELRPPSPPPPSS